MCDSMAVLDWWKVAKKRRPHRRRRRKYTRSAISTTSAGLIAARICPIHQDEVCLSLRESHCMVW